MSGILNPLILRLSKDDYRLFNTLLSRQIGRRQTVILVEAMPEDEPADLKMRLAQSRAGLFRAISGVTEEQFKRRPPASHDDPSPWCIAEVLAHLLDFERMWAGRIALALDAPGSAVQPSDDASHQAAARAGRLAPVPQLIHGLLAVRRELERQLDRAVLADGLERAVSHPERGRLTLRWMVETYGVAHELEHMVQIEALRLAVGAKPAAE